MVFLSYVPGCRDAARVAVRTAITTTVVTWEVAEAGADAYDGHHEENYEDVKIDCRHSNKTRIDRLPTAVDGG